MIRANLSNKLSAMGIGLVMLFGVAGANAAVLEINGPSEVTQGEGSFTFDLLIGDIGALANIDLFSLELSISGPGGASFVLDGGGTGTTPDANYIFAGDSYDFQQYFNATITDNIVASDGSNSGTGILAADAIGKLLSTFTVDLASAIAGVYTISLVSGGNTFLGAADFAAFENPDALTYTFTVVPIPAAAILLGSGLLGLLGFARKKGKIQAVTA